MVDARPAEITINNNKYYSAHDLNKYDSTYFYGCSRTVRNILNRRAITSDNYLYATFNKKIGWTILADQEKPATKALLLLASKWVVKNVPKMMPMLDRSKGSNGSNGSNKSIGSNESNESKESLYEYPAAPEIIILDDEEKFKDNENKTVEIETRGERTPTLFEAGKARQASLLKKL
jgi:hypothetical protein